MVACRVRFQGVLSSFWHVGQNAAKTDLSYSSYPGLTPGAIDMGPRRGPLLLDPFLLEHFGYSNLVPGFYLFLGICHLGFFFSCFVTLFAGY